MKAALPIAAFLLLAPITAMCAPQTPQATPFSLSDVRLTGGPFEQAHEACVKYLLTVDPHRLLHNFRENAGLKPKAAKYGGWEDTGLAGHSLGHYLSACAQEYASSKDPKFKEKIDVIVDELVECQNHRGDGYIGAIPNADKAWAEIKAGNIRSGGFDLNGMWSPWYTVHKIFAGLIDAYHLEGNQKAIPVAEKFADWAIELTKGLSDEQWQHMLGCEYGGMNESLAELYVITKKAKYLELSRKFYDHRVLDPLAEGKDSLPGRHSNTQIPKLIGLARLYEIEGKPKDEKAPKFFWETVVHHHTYVIGGNSNHEYLGPADQLSNQLSTNTCETCNTYNMLKLTRHLFEWEPKASYFDFYERAHINHILASQNPKTAMMTYFVPLVSGGFRSYSDPVDNWTCCHGSGMENHTKHAESVYFHKGGERLWVNLFMPTELHWSEAGVSLKQTTNFPLDGQVSLEITESKGKSFELAIRHPGWVTTPVEVKVNGKVELTSKDPSSYMVIKRAWKKGDKVEFSLPFVLREEAMPDNEKRVALLAGPVVLAADLGSPEAPEPRIPVLVSSGSPDQWLQAGSAPLSYTTDKVGRPSDLKLQPFYQLYESRYAVYFDRFTEEGWQKLEADYRAEEARVKDLEARTLDFMRIGEMQPERDHNLTSEKNDVREANGRGFRTPLNGGWLEFDMKTDPSAETELVLTYWGNDRTHPHFDILIDGEKLVTETLGGRPSNKFFDLTYQLNTKGKSKVRIRIAAHEGKAGGSLCGARMVKKK